MARQNKKSERVPGMPSHGGPRRSACGAPDKGDLQSKEEANGKAELLVEASDKTHEVSVVMCAAGHGEPKKV